MEPEREKPLSLFSLSLSLFSHLAFFLSRPADTHSRAIKFRGAIFINYGMPAGPLCFASFFGACFGLCVFAAVAGSCFAGDIVHNWEVEQGWGFGLLPPRDSLWIYMWGVWECYKGWHGESSAAIHIHSSTTASQRMKKSRSRAHTHTHKLS